MARQMFPRSDDQFNTFQAAFIAMVAAKPDAYGMTPADVTQLQEAQAEWTTTFANHVTKRKEAREASKAKDDARGDHTGSMRKKVRKLNASATVNNAVRVALGLPAHATTRTPTAAPTTRPFGAVSNL